jgi:hypothetical protein
MGKGAFGFFLRLLLRLAFIFGVLPLALSTGAGAGAREAVGVAVVGGMLAASTIGLFIIPPLFSIIQHISEWASPRREPQALELKPDGSPSKSAPS